MAPEQPAQLLGRYSDVPAPTNRQQMAILLAIASRKCVRHAALFLKKQKHGLPDIAFRLKPMTAF